MGDYDRKADTFAGSFRKESGPQGRITSSRDRSTSDIATHVASGGKPLIGRGMGLQGDQAVALLSRQSPVAEIATHVAAEVTELLAGSEMHALVHPIPAPSLTVVMPAHNERHTIAAAIEQVLSLEVPWLLELIVVDDGSTDATALVLGTFEDERLRVIRNSVNRGKGHAVRSGAALARGTHLAVYDADCEYRASDLVRMFDLVLSGRADIVYGTRNFELSGSQGSLYYHLGRRLTTAATNVLFSAQLSDLHTCLKMMPLDVFRSLELSESGFGLDTEITAELLRRGHVLHEIPVSYFGRSRAEGKKISWRDGVGCLRVLANVRRRGQPSIYLNLSDDELGLTQTSLPAAQGSMAC